MSAVVPSIIRTNQEIQRRGYNRVRFTHRYVASEGGVGDGSSPIQEDGQKDVAFLGFLSTSGSLFPSKRVAGVLPADNEQVGACEEDFFPSYSWERGFIISEGARQHLKQREPRQAGEDEAAALSKGGTIAQVISWGCERTGCHFGNCSSTVPAAHTS